MIRIPKWMYFKNPMDSGLYDEKFLEIKIMRVFKMLGIINRNMNSVYLSRGIWKSRIRGGCKGYVKIDQKI